MTASRGAASPARGFTLLEAMVSLVLLVIVLLVAMTMLFQMRAFAERQQYFMLPRQAARRAADYLSFYFAGASDLNYADSTRLSPNALIMYYNLGGNLLQASYNNLTGAETNPGGANNAVLPASGLRPANTSTQVRRHRNRRHHDGDPFRSRPVPGLRAVPGVRRGRRSVFQLPGRLQLRRLLGAFPRTTRPT